ncbi:hypothetical protein EYF80_025482 [Liparis tanakae]|uniref:Uncharacterized protein n=1 Tax=Liparis tanakae TaxID=230148 RepID=A0A4Z2HF45_9TELE|nr:hypothetical protein EYF80_025482 [Liparis tanakae]
MKKLLLCSRLLNRQYGDTPTRHREEGTCLIPSKTSGCFICWLGEATHSSSLEDSPSSRPELRDIPDATIRPTQQIGAAFSEEEERSVSHCARADVMVSPDAAEGGGGKVTVVGGSTGSSMGRTRRVPLMATSCSAKASSWSRPSSEGLVPEERLMVRPDASMLTVTSAYMELTLASFRMKSESSSWSRPSFWRS